MTRQVSLVSLDRIADLRDEEAVVLDDLARGAREDAIRYRALAAIRREVALATDCVVPSGDGVDSGDRVTQ